MSYQQTPVSRCLDKKTLMLGLEVPDLLIVFIFMGVLNFLFGGTSLGIAAVWPPPIILAITLKLIKRGKPDDYILHLLRFHFRCKKLSAFKKSEKFNFLPTSRYSEKRINNI